MHTHALFRERQSEPTCPRTQLDDGALHALKEKSVEGFFAAITGVVDVVPLGCFVDVAASPMQTAERVGERALVVAIDDHPMIPCDTSSCRMRMVSKRGMPEISRMSS